MNRQCRNLIKLCSVFYALFIIGCTNDGNTEQIIPAVNSSEVTISPTGNIPVGYLSTKLSYTRNTPLFIYNNSANSLTIKKIIVTGISENNIKNGSCETGEIIKAKSYCKFEITTNNISANHNGVIIATLSNGNEDITVTQILTLTRTPNISNSESDIYLQTGISNVFNVNKIESYAASYPIYFNHSGNYKVTSQLNSHVHLLNCGAVHDGYYKVEAGSLCSIAYEFQGGTPFNDNVTVIKQPNQDNLKDSGSNIIGSFNVSNNTGNNHKLFAGSSQDEVVADGTTPYLVYFKNVGNATINSVSMSVDSPTKSSGKYKIGVPLTIKSQGGYQTSLTVTSDQCEGVKLDSGAGCYITYTINSARGIGPTSFNFLASYTNGASNDTVTAAPVYAYYENMTAALDVTTNSGSFVNIPLHKYAVITANISNPIGSSESVFIDSIWLNSISGTIPKGMEVHPNQCLKYLNSGLAPGKSCNFDIFFMPDSATNGTISDTSIAIKGHYATSSGDATIANSIVLPYNVPMTPSVFYSEPAPNSTVDLNKDYLIKIGFSSSVYGVGSHNISLIDKTRQIFFPIDYCLATDEQSKTYTCKINNSIDASIKDSDGDIFNLVINKSSVSGIVDAYGNNLPEKVIQFYQVDKTPTGKVLAPLESNNVNLKPIFLVQWSEKIIASTAKIYDSTNTLKYTLQTSLGVDHNISYTMQDTESLLEQTSYRAEFTGVDQTGNVGVLSYTFTSGDVTRPQVTMVNPANNATNVSLLPTVTMQFSESVLNVNNTNITLRYESALGESVPISNITLVGNNLYKFTSLNKLSQQKQYYVAFQNITDTVGNKLPDTTYSFTTKIESWTILAPNTLTNISASQSLALAPDGIPYVAFQDHSNGIKLTVMKFNGTSWVNVGSPGFSSAEIFYPSLKIDRSGVPYVAYQDAGNQYKTTVMKFNGTSWVSVGSPGFSAGNATYQSLAIGSDGTPYVAYRDNGNSGKANVMTFNKDTSSWVNVGIPGVSANAVSYLSLDIAPDGTPYVAYRDDGNNYKAMVMKLIDGYTWIPVGGTPITSDPASFESLKIDKNGTLYLAFEDNAHGFRASVVKFNGASWVNVGNPGFSVSSASYESLAIAPDGTLYLAYRDANSEKTSVMKFNNTSWVSVGNPEFATYNNTAYQSLDIAPDGTPYVAYQTYSPNSGITEVMKFD